MLYILLGISVVCSTARTLFSKKLGSISKRFSDIFFFNGISFVVIFVIASVGWGITRTGLSTYTLLWGLIFGIVSLAAQMFYMKALSGGVTGICTLFFCSSFIFPALVGVIWGGEPIVWAQIVGAVLILTAFFVSAFSSSRDTSLVLSEEREMLMDEVSVSTKKPAQKNTKTWIIFAVLSMLANGFLGVVQKIHQTSTYKEELFAFLFVAYAAGAIVAFLGKFILSQKIDAKKRNIGIDAIDIDEGIPSWRRGMGFAVLGGLAFGAVNVLNLYLAGTLPSMVFFPVCYGGFLVLAAVAGAVIFKEKITKVSAVGLILGVAGILLITLKPF